MANLVGILRPYLISSGRGRGERVKKEFTWEERSHLNLVVLQLAWGLPDGRVHVVEPGTTMGAG